MQHHARRVALRPVSTTRRRHLYALVAVLATGIGALSTIGTAAYAGPALLSQGKAATASSTEAAGTPAAAALDGNTGTRWSSAFSDPQWLQVDLGSTAAISQVVLNWQNSYAVAFQIQVSDNGTSWTT